jgi:tetratricopeptide (TPR) repeat protein
MTWSCVSTRTAGPSIYIESLSPLLVSQLTLDERIIVEDALDSLKNGDPDKAERFISRLDEQRPFYKAGLGYVSLLMNDLAEAEKLFKESTAAFPDMTLSYIGLAQIYQNTGRIELAFSSYREILKRDPEHAWAKPRFERIKVTNTEEYLAIARAFLKQEEKEQSKEAYLRALYFTPDSIEAHFALAQIFKAENKLQNALVHIKAADSAFPQNPEILSIFGDILFETEDYKESLKIYEQLLELDPDNQESAERLQTIKNRLGIFELPSQYNSIVSSTAVSRQEVAALLGVKFKEILEDPAGQPRIITDISTSWASTFILKMTSLEILEVYPNHTFQPRKTVTRAEMAQILYRLIQALKKKGYSFIQQIPPSRIQIQDVAPDNFYFMSIITLLSYDIMTLSTDKRFRPDTAVSGRESIKYLDIILALIQ